MHKTINKSWNEQSLETFFCREISDFDAAIIVGGVVVGVSAEASAMGDRYLALTNTKTVAAGSLGYGYGSAIAVGNNPTSNVSVFGTGNFVWKYNKTYTTKNQSISAGFIIAGDLR